ncbi:hypothetical protein D3C87_1938790 [compost metagenome]
MWRQLPVFALCAERKAAKQTRLSWCGLFIRSKAGAADETAEGHEHGAGNFTTGRGNGASGRGAVDHVLQECRHAGTESAVAIGAGRFRRATGGRPHR